MFFTRSTRRASALLAGTAALALAAGCGSDDGDGDGGDDEAAISAVITKGVTTTDVEEKCVETVTTGFVTAVYGDLATCRAAESDEDDDDPPPTGAATTDIAVDGDSATAKVTIEGSNTDGATGTITLAREDGDWKVSELGIDLLRSQLSTGFEKGDFGPDDGPLQDAAVRGCINDGLQALDDAKFRSIAYASIAEKDPPAEFNSVIAECISQGGADSGADSGADDAPADDTSSGDTADDGEQSLLRRQFEEGIRESAEGDGATAEQIDCVLRETRKTISEDEIVEQVGRGADNVAPELAQKAAAAIQKCG
jgi:hypothetical protein